MATDDDRVLCCRLPASERGLAQLGPWVDAVCAKSNLDPQMEYALRLCLEEVVANVVMHGAAPGTTIALSVQVGCELITVRIDDEGAPFDPTAAPPVRMPQGEGGRGLTLLRRYARTITYRREPGWNRLTLTLAR
ncbi:MAG: ATP-binding protein [Rhodospirillales bacterium]|nr:ATP-binding protein [Rhodospirillales bacterium]